MADSGFRHELDINTLSWVKSEIDTTLEQAHKALEAYEESPDDDSQIKFCLNYLHQVHGTLKMVELYGASLAAEELENLTLALSENRVSNRDETFQVLIKGMVQLPDYLENLLSGHKDIPVVLLPLLNDMRAARGESLLTENALFSPDMDVIVPVHETAQTSTDDIQLLAKKLRHSYHLGLLNWFTDKNVPGGIKLISKVVDQLRDAASDVELNKLLWVVSGVMEGLREGGLESSIAVKLLAGNVDREIKKIIDNGEVNYLDESSKDLIKNLLYYVSCSSTNGDAVKSIKQAFKLQDLMPNPKTLEKARADLEGPNAALMQTVSTVLMDELTQVKDNLDVFVRSENKDVEHLKPLSSALSQMSDTLGMLGLGIQRATIKEQKQRLDGMISGDKEISDTVLMDVAGSLLSVENSLNDLGQLKGNKFNNDTVEQTLQNAEKQKLLKSVISEAKVDLSNVKESLSAFSRDPSNHDLLKDIPTYLSQIQGSLSILNLTRASDLLDECNQFIQNDLIDEQAVPELATLETLADAISSIEYFLESLAENWGQPDAILEVAEQSLKKIRGEKFSLDSNDNKELVSPLSSLDESLGELEVNLTQEIGFDTQIEIDSSSLDNDDSDVSSSVDEDATEIIKFDAPLEIDSSQITDDDATQEIKLETALDIDTNILSLDSDIDISGKDTSVVNLNFDGTQSEEFILEPGLSLEVDNEPFNLTSDTTKEEGVEGSNSDGLEVRSDFNDLELPELELQDDVNKEKDISVEPDISPPNSEGSPDPFDLTKLDNLPPTEEITTQEARDDIASEEQSAIERMSSSLTKWYDDSQSDDNTKQLRDSFSELSTQLTESNNDNALKIIHDMEGIFNCVVSGEESFNDDLINTLNWARETLEDLLSESTEPDAFSEDFNLTEGYESDSRLGKETTNTLPDISESTPPGRTFLADIDEEIIEIFLEEAQEEFDNIVRLYPIWKNDTQNYSSLKDMRRSFHTLKGSGRLVGAVELGEFAWSFENMLNHVIDGAIELSPVLFDVIEEAIAVFPVLFEQITTGEKLEHKVLRLMDVAENLSLGNPVAVDVFSKQTDVGAETGIELPTENISDESADNVFVSEEFQITQPEPAETIDEISSNENIISINGDDSISKLEPQDELEDIDLTQTISETDFEQVDLNSDKNDNEETEEVSLDDLTIEDQIVTDSQNTDVPENVISEIDFPDVELLETELPDIEIANFSASDYVAKDNLDESDSSVEQAESTLNKDIEEVSDDIDIQDTAEMVLEQSADEQLKTEELSDADPALIDIYKSEAKTHIESLEQYVYNWENENTKKVTPELIRALHTLKGSSRTTGFIPLAETCAELEKVAKLLEDKDLEIAPNVLNVLQENLSYAKEIVNLVDKVSAEVPDNKILLGNIIDIYHSLMQPDEKDNITAAPDLTPHVEESEQYPVSHDYDEELLEIFLEEGIEILEDSDHCIHNWIEEKENPKYIEELQRYLHTLKGGARMAGISEIGNLAHSLESVLTAVVQGSLPINDDVFKILQKSHDQLVKMLEQIAARQPLDTGENLLNQVDALLAGEPIIDIDIASDEEFEEQATEENLIPEIDDSSNKLIDNEVIVNPEDLNQENIEALYTKDNTDLQSEESEIEEYDESKLAGKISESLYENLSDTSDIVDLDDNVVAINSSGLPVEQEPVIADITPVDNKEISARRGTGEQVRVRADLLDSLVNFAGEVSIYRSRMEQQVNTFRYNLVEFDDTVLRLRSQLRQFEIETETQIQSRYQHETGITHADFDPLEFDRFTQMQQLSRGMLESLNDLDSLRSILSNLTRESETLLVQQSRVNTELQEGLMRTRMVPFSVQVSRLRRIVRQTADELDKQVELKLSGVENEIDRTVLERILAPLEHMLRNAIAHGIESPKQRLDLGKPEKGVIDLIIARDGSDLIITISDDGQGLDLDAIRAKAIERGKIEADASVTDHTLFEMILEPGFSTAVDVTQISGRGVGMDVVNSEVQQLGGVFNLESERGQGSKFSIRLPLTLSITRALMVNIADETFALPLLSVQGIERIASTDVSKLIENKNTTYHWVGEDYKLIHLASEMGIAKPDKSYDKKMMPLLLVQSGEYRAAIVVDHLIGSREVVVKNIGPELSVLRGISGATIMGDGSVVLILDLSVLIQLTMSIDYDATVYEQIEEKVEKVFNVMVVDDSITVRKVTTRFLERNQMAVTTAKDGVDALAQLLDFIPDVMLLDVEMPRMDGFELANNMRNDDRLKNIPIIMITSRTGDKHRNRAMDIGVNAYIGKPYQEIELLEIIQNLIKK